MISKAMNEALNKQINAELYSSYLYFSMAAQAMALGLAGTAHWFEVQTKEESDHASKFFEYINDQGGRVVLSAIDQPPVEFASLPVMIEESLKHEQKVTKAINGLVDLARAEKDYATEIFLQWFVSEQVEEEQQLRTILDAIKLMGSHTSSYYYLDHELGERNGSGECKCTCGKCCCKKED